MIMIRFQLLAMILTLFLNCGPVPADSGNELEQARNVVEKYIVYSLEHSLEFAFNPKSYYHPDAIWPGSDAVRIAVVCPQFTVTSVKKARRNINLMNPKDEEIVEITVLFPTIGFVREMAFSSAMENFERTFYLSKSTGSYLILDMSKPQYSIATLDEIIMWAKYNSQKKDTFKALEQVLREIANP